jgi:hypothetical protein
MELAAIYLDDLKCVAEGMPVDKHKQTACLWSPLDERQPAAVYTALITVAACQALPNISWMRERLFQCYLGAPSGDISCSRGHLDNSACMTIHSQHAMIAAHWLLATHASHPTPSQLRAGCILRRGAPYIQPQRRRLLHAVR